MWRRDRATRAKDPDRGWRVTPFGAVVLAVVAFCFIAAIVTSSAILLLPGLLILLILAGDFS
jgi:hypothetical protein